MKHETKLHMFLGDWIIPKQSMDGIIMYYLYTYIWVIIVVNVGQYTIHGLYGIRNSYLKHITRTYLREWPLIGIAEVDKRMTKSTWLDG